MQLPIFRTAATLTEAARSAQRSAMDLHATAIPFEQAFQQVQTLSDALKKHVDALAQYAPPKFNMPEFIGFKYETEHDAK